MKHIIMAIFGIVFLYTTANASHITILSEYHHIWGYAGSTDAVYNAYDLASNQPVSMSVDDAYYNGDELESSHSSAFAGNLSIDVKAGRWSAEAVGESTYIFTSDYDKLLLSVNGYVGCHADADYDFVSIQLQDLTVGASVYNYLFKPYYDDTWGDMGVFGVNEEISINSNHTYMLEMFAVAGISDSYTMSRLVCGVSSQPVPEPATACFFVAGIAALTGLKRKKTS